MVQFLKRVDKTLTLALIGGVSFLVILSFAMGTVTALRYHNKTQLQVAPGFKYVIGSALSISNNPKYDSTVALATPEGDTFCSGVVIDAKLILTAAHCVVDMLGGLSTEPIKIFTSEGKDSGIIGRAVVARGQADLAVIEADVSEFAVSRLGAKRPDRGMHYQSCGFPGGVRIKHCEVGINNGNVFFFDTYDLRLLPGMSGGPVFDLITREVVGINSAVNQPGLALIAPVVAAKGMLRLE